MVWICLYVIVTIGVTRLSIVIARYRYTFHSTGRTSKSDNDLPDSATSPQYMWIRRMQQLHASSTPYFDPTSNSHRQHFTVTHGHQGHTPCSLGCPRLQGMDPSIPHAASTGTGQVRKGELSRPDHTRTLASLGYRGAYRLCSRPVSYCGHWQCGTDEVLLSIIRLC